MSFSNLQILQKKKNPPPLDKKQPEKPSKPNKSKT